MSKSWKPEVIADNSGKWCGNALRFATREEAEANVSDLAWRWTLVRDTRVVESDDPVNYKWHDGKLVAVESLTPVTTIVAVVGLVLALAAAVEPAHAQNQTTFRDSSGRTTGTATTDSQGTTVFRDAGGRTTGTASPDSQGTVTFRNSGGMPTGTMSMPPTLSLPGRGR